MKRKSKRFLAWLLSAALIVSLLPCMAVQAFDMGKVGEYQTISAGQYHTAAIKKDNSLWTWGSNGWGQLGDGTTNSSYKPIKIMSDVVAVSAGQLHTAAIKNDGSLWTWGYNYAGQLGNGTTNDSYKPIEIMDDIVAISAGQYHTAAIKSDGSLWTWGRNDFGQLGDGTRENHSTPIKVMDDVTAISAGERYTAAIKSDSDGQTWGYNKYGQLGFGKTDDVVAISAGYDHTAAIKSDGSLRTWGHYWYTQLNSKMDDVIATSVGATHTVALKSDGSLWTWGENNYGQLGDDAYSSHYTPIKVMDDVKISCNHTPQLELAIEAPTPTPTPQPLSLKIYCNEPSLSTTVGNVFTVGAAMQGDNGNYGSPEDITFDIEDESILRAVKTTDDGETRQLTFNALKEGTTVIKIKDKSTGQKGELPFTVNKANGNAYTIYNVPNLGDDKKANFNNFSGLYVDSFKVNRQGNGSAVVSFDVYNKNYTSASVEVYNADGEMTDAEVIDKCDFETSISDTFGTMFNIGKDIWNGVYNPLSYKSSIQSKHTPIKNLTIPRGGYLKITPDTRESAVCGASNGLDIIGQVMSLSGDIMDVSSMKKKKGDIAKTVTEKLKDGGKEFMEAYSKGMTTEISNRTLASRSDVKEFIGAINDIFSQGDMKELAVSVFTDSAVDLGKSSAEEWFTKNSGPAGKALSGFFKFSEIDNLIMQASDFAKKANKGGIIIQAPDGSTRRCSDVTVNCKMNDNTALDVYRLDKNSIEIRQAKKAYPTKLGSSIEGYNITLSENGEERQPEGKAEVTIDIPSYMSGSKNIAVYRLEKNGSITDMNGEVTGSTVTFETDHFSTYLLTEDGKENELPELKEGQTVINGDTIVSDWAAEEVQEAFDENLVPDVLRGADLTKRVDRAEFAAIAVTLYEKLSSAKAQAGNNPFGDISDSVCKEDILKAYSLGITNGITDTRFEPSTLISREQVATMLTRAYKKSEFPSWTLETDGKYPLNYMGVTRYADDDEISDYAKESVYFMTRWDILNGVDDSHFAPKNNTTLGESYGYATREQAVVIALRSAKHL